MTKQANRIFEGIEAKIYWKNNRPSWKQILVNAAAFVGLIVILAVVAGVAIK